jgi:hypothetical protein
VTPEAAQQVGSGPSWAEEEAGGDPGQDAVARPEERGSLRERLHNAGVAALVGNLLAIGSFAAVLADLPDIWFLSLGSLALILPLVLELPTADQPASRGLVPGIAGRVAVAIGAVSLHPDPGVEHWLAGAVLAALVVFEDPLLRIERGAIPYAAHLPGTTVRNSPVVPAFAIQLLNIALIVLVALLNATATPSGPMFGLLAIGAIAAGAVAADGVLRIRARRAAERTIGGRIDALAPRFALHWDAPKGTGYQVAAWLPYLERIGVPFLVIVRNPGSFAEVAKATSAPVLLRRGPQDLDAMVPMSMRSVFYVNNSMRNSHMVRYPAVKHIQLNHGESDKAPSYSPVFRMFDKDFVAGQAAIDRFARFGVEVSPDLFEIVGRPQLEDVDVRESGEIRTVLYAPTWKGHNADTGHSSLEIGEDIVEHLLRRGLRVIYRPHPYTNRDARHRRLSREIDRRLAAHSESTGTAHVFGLEATKRLSLLECFNESDALISDVSSVVGDFLYSLKPFAITAMDMSVRQFRASYPIASAAYVIARDGGNLDLELGEMLAHDPRRAERRELKTYVLGDHPADCYADAFLQAARRFV